MGYPPTKVASVPREILVTHPDVEIRNDFIDCSIDICSVEVLSNYSHLVFLLGGTDCIPKTGSFFIPGQL
jgi:hypothetical protein